MIGHALHDPWAEHPVVNRHICFGGGGTSAPNPPDYSGLISKVTGIGDQLSGWGSGLMDWAHSTGQSLAGLAGTVSGNMGNIANWATTLGQDTMANWQQEFGPLYQNITSRAQQLSANVPALQDAWAGKYGADAAAAIDQGKAAETRKLQGEGLAAPSIGQGAIDMATQNQRSLAITTQAEAGRLAAQQYADQYGFSAAGLGPAMAGVGQGAIGQGMQAGAQQAAIPMSAASTTAGLYAPGISSYTAAMPYYNTWQNAMSTSYNQQLQQFQANQQASSNSPLSTILPLAAGIGASFLAPGVGTLAAGAMGSMAPSLMSAGASYLNRGIGSSRAPGSGSIAATGGAVADMAVQPGGPVPVAGRTVPAAMSPSGGQQTDDVHAVIDGNPNNKAAINTGEFIIPRWATEWYGEKFFQNLIS